MKMIGTPTADFQMPKVAKCTSSLLVTPSGKEACLLEIHPTNLQYSRVEEPPGNVKESTKTTLIIPLDLISNVQESLDYASGESIVKIQFKELVFEFQDQAEAEMARAALLMPNEMETCVAAARCKYEGNEDTKLPGRNEHPAGKTDTSQPENEHRGKAAGNDQRRPSNEFEWDRSRFPSHPTVEASTTASPSIIDNPGLNEIPTPLPLARSAPRRTVASEAGAYAVNGQSRRLAPGNITRSDNDNAAGESRQSNDNNNDNNTQISEVSNQDMLVEATLVNDGHVDDPEQPPNNEGLGHGNVVFHAKPLEASISRRTATIAALIVALIIAGMLVGFLVFGPAIQPALPPSLAPSMAPTSSQKFRNIPTLDRIQDRGKLLCGAYSDTITFMEVMYSHEEESFISPDIVAVSNEADAFTCFHSHSISSLVVFLPPF
jgi:hypothetical protein